MSDGFFHPDTLETLWKILKSYNMKTDHQMLHKHVEVVPAQCMLTLKQKMDLHNEIHIRFVVIFSLVFYVINVFHHKNANFLLLSDV